MLSTLIVKPLGVNNFKNLNHSGIETSTQKLDVIKKRLEERDADYKTDGFLL